MTRCCWLPGSSQWGYDQAKVPGSTNTAPVRALTPLCHRGLRNEGSASSRCATVYSMADVDGNVLRNADAPWNRFSSHDYWRRNYSKLQAEEREIIRRVSHFPGSALAGCPPVQRAIDVDAGTNLYPALLMLPWTERILPADFSKSNVSWLHDQLADNASPRGSDKWWFSVPPRISTDRVVNRINSRAPIKIGRY
jgi:hypothetical protein